MTPKLLWRPLLALDGSNLDFFFFVYVEMLRQLLMGDGYLPKSL
jgi:hypothetical protein